MVAKPPSTLFQQVTWMTKVLISALVSNAILFAPTWLQISANGYRPDWTYRGTHSVQDYPKQDDSTISNVVMFARSVPSFYPVYQRDLATGAYLLDENNERMFDYGEYRPNSYAKYNLLASMPHDKSEIKTWCCLFTWFYPNNSDQRACLQDVFEHWL